MTTIDIEKNQLHPCLKKMIAGDQRALEEIILLYEKPIFNHLLRLTHDHDEASELLQDTFVKMYTKRSQIDPSGHFKNWIYRVATNTAYDYFRKKKREKLVSLDDENTFETIDEEISYTTTEQEVVTQDLEKALQEIRPHYRNILLLYYKEGFSYEEIARILELPLNTVKTHLRRARGELSILLKNTYG